MTEMIRGIDKQLMFRFFVLNTKEVVEQARQFHQTSPVATAALGRMLTAGLMIGYTLKNEKDKVTLRINGGGPLGTILVTANNNGQVKGYVENPHIDLPAKENGKLDVGNAVGKEGYFQLIKDSGLKEPYSGSSKLVSGEIGDDIAAYFFYSEQQPTVVALGVLIDVDGSVKSAGGFMLQLMPGLVEEEIASVENAIRQMNQVSSYFDTEDSLEMIAKNILKDFELEITEKIPVMYFCDCTQERMEQVLISLGYDELNDIYEQDEKAEIICHFCNKKYQFEKQDLKHILDQLADNGSTHACDC